MAELLRIAETTHQIHKILFTITSATYIIVLSNYYLDRF